MTELHDAKPVGAAARYRVVVVGGGFGGLEAARLAGTPVDITLIDQRNHHIFQPLLYQVATASLTSSDIAGPLRMLFRKRPEVTTLLATVVGVDSSSRLVFLNGGQSMPYDTLVLATGARHAYFGHDEWACSAPVLKSLEDATTIRRRILLAFEEAEREPDPLVRTALLTFVIVGGGSTGVELAGTIAALARTTLADEFRNVDTKMTRVVLIEAGPRVLAAFPEDLSIYAQRSLESLGVVVELSHAVSNCTADGVAYGDRTLDARTVIWAAGVRASPAAEWLGAPADHAGRLIVGRDFTVPGHPERFAIGDTVVVAGRNGKPVSGGRPRRETGGRHVAQVIKARLEGLTTVPFVYKDLGSLAQIGKRRAVIDFGWITLRGPVAWWIWGVVHIYFLICVRRRLSVAINTLWIDTRSQRGDRLITEGNSS